MAYCQSLIQFVSSILDKHDAKSTNSEPHVYVFVIMAKIPHATEQLSPCATTTEACAPRARAPQQEKPPP